MLCLRWAGRSPGVMREVSAREGAFDRDGGRGTSLAGTGRGDGDRVGTAADDDCTPDCFGTGPNLRGEFCRDPPALPPAGAAGCSGPFGAGFLNFIIVPRSSSNRLSRDDEVRGRYAGLSAVVCRKTVPAPPPPAPSKLCEARHPGRLPSASSPAPWSPTNSSGFRPSTPSDGDSDRPAGVVADTTTFRGGTSNSGADAAAADLADRVPAVPVRVFGIVTIPVVDRTARLDAFIADVRAFPPPPPPRACRSSSVVSTPVTFSSTGSAGNESRTACGTTASSPSPELLCRISSPTFTERSPTDVPLASSWLPYSCVICTDGVRHFIDFDRAATHEFVVRGKQSGWSGGTRTMT
mmetsp:Transcript_8419/g.23733  ORF Transcript_8419/g.23733 Transcript_8419/m.23733 type:complete len:352 (-) Transcript_8419:351-1406(-)